MCSFDFRKSPPQVTPTCTAHLSVLFGIFFVQRATSYWLARYALTLHTNGVVLGLRYVDQLLWKPGLWLLVALAVIAAAICFANLRERGLRLLVAAAVVAFGPSIIMNLLQPAIERLWVNPDELQVEEPYLMRNIEMTRRAYRLDTVDVRPFEGVGELTTASLEQDSTTIKNIRLWDPRPLIATYRQLQEIRLHYDFKDVDIDRYWIDNSETQVMLSARELKSTCWQPARNLGQPTPQVHAWLWNRDEPGPHERPGRHAGPVYQEHSASIIGRHRNHPTGHLLRQVGRRLRDRQSAHTRIRLPARQ